MVHECSCSRLCRPLVLFLSVVTFLAVAPAPVVAAEDSARPGTIPWMRSLPVGSGVKLDAMMVDTVGAGYLIVREPCAPVETIMLDTSADVKRWQCVEVTGVSALDSNGQLYLAKARVFAYLDSDGGVMLIPIPKSTVAPFARWGTVDVTLPPGEELGESEEQQGSRTESMLDFLEEGTIPYVKSLTDDEPCGDLEDKVITALYPDRFYIEEPSRCSGIMVYAAPPANARVGKLVDVTGGTVTTIDGEKAIDPGSVTLASQTAGLAPWYLGNAVIGGGDWLYDEGTGAGQRGVEGGVGLNNIGLLVRTYGNVTELWDDYLVVTDGSLSELMVDHSSASLVHHLTPGSRVAATGISSCALDGESLLPVLKARACTDLQDLSDTTGPSTPVVRAASFSTVTSKLFARWSSADSESGIVGCNYAIGTSASYPPGSYLVEWTDWIPASSNEIICEGSFSAGQDYYFYVKTLNGAGIASAVGVSNATHCALNQVVYVKLGGSGQGTSWPDAYGDVSEALQNCDEGQEVWVAEGEYVDYVIVNNGQSLYGGFAGAEFAREQRDWQEHVTVLRKESGQEQAVWLYADSEAVVDGFKITGGGTGILCQHSDETVTIAHNLIEGNSSGIYVEYGAPTILGNWIRRNTDGIFCYESYSPGPLIANNTITGSETGNGIYLEVEQPFARIQNNIIADNAFGVYNNAWGSTVTLRNNCYHGNAQADRYQVPEGYNEISVDPELSGVHLQPNSPCIGVGYNGAVPSGATDYHGEARRQPTGGVVDIGADESDGCGFYTITTSANPSWALPGGSVTVTAHIADWNSECVPNARVCFGVTDVTITHVNGREMSGPTCCGYTDASGNATVTVTRSITGTGHVTAEVARSCGAGTTTKSRLVWFGAPEDEDWPMFMHDTGHTGLNPVPIEAGDILELAWSAEAQTASTQRSETWSPHRQPGGRDAGFIFEHPYIDSSPAVVGSTVVVGTWTRGTSYSNGQGSVKAFNALTGAPIWTATGNPAMGGVAATPCIHGGKVYVGTSNGRFYCLDLASGSQLWSQATYDRSTPEASSKIIASAVVHGGTVYVGNEAAKVYAFDCETGALQTGYPVVLPIESHGVTDLSTKNMTGVSSPAVATVSGVDYLLFGCDDGYIYRLRLGDRDLAGVNLTYCVESSPTVAGGETFVGISRYRGPEVFRLSVAPLQVLASYQLGQECRATMAWDQEWLYVGVDTGWTFHKITPETMHDDGGVFSAGGALPPYRDYFVGSAGIAAGRAYVGNDNGRLYVLETEDLSEVFTYSQYLNQGHICSSPALVWRNGEWWVYVVSRVDNGKLLAFRAVSQ